MTDDELAAIEARMDVWSDYGPDPTDTITRLLAALRTEQEARARVEGAARRLSDAISDKAAIGTDVLFSIAQQDAADDEYRAALRGLRAALAPASEGGET